MAKKKKTATWGGKRKGAGRPTSHDAPLVRRSITLTEEDIRTLEQAGDGNLSAGIRLAAMKLRKGI